jgi:hypothetical protein
VLRDFAQKLPKIADLAKPSSNSSTAFREAVWKGSSRPSLGVEKEGQVNLEVSVNSRQKPTSKMVEIAN